MSGRAQILFSEAQPLARWHTRVALAIPALTLAFVTYRQIVLHRAWQAPAVADGDLVFLTILTIAVYFRLTTVRLVTELRRSELTVRLRGLWKRRLIPLDSVRSTAVVDHNAALDFGGYGMRTGRRGTAYIAGGNRGVELAMNDGRKIVIGSQRPDELARRIAETRSRTAI